MKLLSSVAPRVRKLIPSAERGLSLFLVGFVLALELLGRQAPSDFYDLAAGLAVASVGTFVVSWHRRYPLSWLGWADRLAAKIAKRFGRLKYELGIDFRGNPPLPRRVPRFVPLTVFALLAWTGIAFAAWSYPGGWRELGLRTSYVAYLVGLMTVWALLLGCALAGIYLPVWSIDRRLRTARGEDSPGVDAVALVGYLFLAVLVAWVTPPIYAVATSAAVACVAFLAYLLNRDRAAAFLWRTAAGEPVKAVPMKRAVAVAVGLLALGIVALLVTAAGGRLTAPPTFEGPMALTTVLGAFVAWLVPGVLLVLAAQLFDLHRSDPARNSPPTLHVALGSRADRWRVGGLANRWGWRAVLAPAPRESAYVGIHVVPPELSQATEFEPAWPLAVSFDDLGNANVRDRLVRRDEIQLRRQFFRSLATLLKRVKLATPSAGGGHWFAPHWWFIDSVQWEEPQPRGGGEFEQLKPVGPGFGEAFPLRVRQYLYRVLRAAEVDLVYVEAGVGPRTFVKVWRALFEAFDRSAGLRRAEDHHFLGLAKVRVMIHEYAPGSPFAAPDGYPEPKFDEVSRFRVLHAFKDRGGEDVEVSPPFDFSWEPTPLGVA